MTMPHGFSDSEGRKPGTDRLAILIGDEGVARLRKATVAVVGLGGVGSWAAEALARSGVGRLVLVDGDNVGPTDLNRQLFATVPALGMPKPMAATERLAVAAPDTIVTPVTAFLTCDNLDLVFDHSPSVVVDCIDRMEDKRDLVVGCVQRGIPVVSSMGAGGRLSSVQLRTADISSTTGCPMARKFRKMLKDAGIASGVRAVYSLEPARPPADRVDEGRRPQGSAIWVTASFGMSLACETVQLLLSAENGLKS